MKKNALYYICKVLNWVIPVAMIFSCYVMLSMNPYLNCCVAYIVIAYAAFWFIKYWGYGRGGGRTLYNLCAFAGSVITMYIVLDDEVCIFETIFSDPISATSFAKTIITALCVTAIVSRLITLIFETKEYNEGAQERYEERLDADVLDATDRVQHATDYQEEQRAMAQLEAAKVRRDRYYNQR